MIKRRLTTLFIFMIGGLFGWVGSQANWHRNATAQDDALPIESETAIVAEAAPADSPLETLDWLIGSWVDDVDNPNIEFSCQFTKNNAFMIRSFKSIRDESPMSGMQVVAWDPARQTIRSWTFDSDGGFGEDAWSQAGNRYTIRTKYTLPDGGIASALNVLAYVDDDTFTWRSVNREIDGSFQPDVDEVTLVRADVDQPESSTDSNTNSESNTKTESTSGDSQ